MRPLSVLVLLAAAGIAGPLSLKDVFDPYHARFPETGNRFGLKKKAFETAAAAAGPARTAKEFKRMRPALDAIQKRLDADFKRYEKAAAKYHGWKAAYTASYEKKHGRKPAEYNVPPGINQTFLDAEKTIRATLSIKRREHQFHLWAERRTGEMLAALDEGRRAKAVVSIAAGLKARDPVQRVRAVELLEASGDPGAAQLLARFCESEKNPTAYAAALRAHARVATEGREALLARALTHAAWPVRAGAMRAATFVRSKEAVDLLVARLPLETGRLRDDANAALADLTGRGETDWAAWWKGARESFTLPPRAKRDPEEERTKPHGIAGEGPTTFLGVATASRHVVLCLDGAPGSWNAVREQAEACLATIPETGTFGIVVCDDDPRPWRKKLASANGTNKKSALAALGKYEPKTGADLCRGMLAALDLADAGRNQPPAADTIFLLSVRGPTAGMVTDGIQVTLEINARNRALGVRIHALGPSLARDAYWLQEMVRPFDGVWRDLN